jgi:hypothetical protein
MGGEQAMQADEPRGVDKAAIEAQQRSDPGSLRHGRSPGSRNRDKQDRPV